MTYINGVVRIIAVLFLLKVGYLLFAYFSGNINEINYDSYKYSLSRNDFGWYSRIATNGYSTITQKRDLAGGWYDGRLIQSEWAFFPAYPSLCKAITNIAGWSVFESALLLSYIFSITTFVGLFTFCCLYCKNNLQAFYITILVMVFPFHYYYSMFYTEALFFTFMIFSFICIYKKQYLLLSLFLIPLTLIRPNGIVLVAPLYFYYLEQTDVFQNWSFDWKKLFSRSTILNSLYFLAAPIALGIYCLYQYSKTGYYFAFAVAQGGWGKTTMMPYNALYQYHDQASNLMDMFNSTYTVIAMIFALFAWRKLPLSFNILIWLAIILPLTAGSVISMPRYISTLFPLFIILAYHLYKTKYKFLILGCLFCLQLYTYYHFFNNSPLGF